MKKLLSIVLAVAVLSTMAFSMVGFSASAAETVSLLPSSADKFEKQEGDSAGKGTVTITAEGDGYKFVSDQGWPNGFYWAEDSWVTVDVDADLYLNYDFEVKSGASNVIVYFAGQNPNEMASKGSFICLNGLVDPSYINALTGDAVTDLPVGKYSGSVKVGDLGCREDLIAEGKMIISGFKVFAVGGEVVVNELSVGPKSNDTVTTAAGSDAATTTANKGNTATTTTPKTADTTESMLFVVVAAAAVAVVTVSAVASKKAKSR